MKTFRKTKLALAVVALASASGCGILVPGSNDEGCGENSGAVPAPVSALRYGGRSNVVPANKMAPTIAWYADCKVMKADIASSGWSDEAPMRGVSNSQPSPPSDVQSNIFAKATCQLPHITDAASSSSGTPPARAQAKAESVSNGSGASSVKSDVAADAAPGAGSEGGTNVQEKGVDEADFVKIGAHHIYVQRGEMVEVAARTSYKALGGLSLKGLSNITLYTDEDTLIAIGTVAPDYTKETPYYIYQEPKTRVVIFHGAEGKLPVLAKDYSFSGTPADSRYLGGRLVLVFQSYLRPEAFTDEKFIDDVPCDHVMQRPVPMPDNSLTKIVSLNAQKLDESPQYLAVLGGSDRIYMTEKALYLARSVMSYGDVTPATDEDFYGNAYRDNLVISKITFDAKTGVATPVAVGVIDGRVKDQWAFKELEKDGEDLLSVATTTGQLWSQGSQMAQNHLFVLRQKETSLDVAATVPDFGTGEDIRSVRYFGSMAYVVTFKKTDPLFAIDLTDPLAPKMLGELKMPGFSTYMHPVGGGKIVGIGFDADDQGDFAWYQGLQVSLFDVSNPTDLQRLDNKIIGQRGSSSEVTADHHAFYFDPDLRLIGIPLTELNGKESDQGPEMAPNLAFTGAALFQIGDKELTEVARVSHDDLIPGACKSQLTQGHWWQDDVRSLDINRLYTLDGKIVSISRFGIKTLDPTHLSEKAVAQTTFPADESEAFCVQENRPMYD